ncbi:WW domain-containing oxidoreductase [Diplonema papillatum]|nr:WW domain-containing oxidoreductase [Diplonema papillatum]
MSEQAVDLPTPAKTWAIWRLWGGPLLPLPEDVRMDGKVCLVTGANTGLGRAVAVDLGKRGAKLILVCRPGHDEAVEEIRKETGAEVTYLKADLSMMVDVSRLCDEMKEKKLRVDVAVMNAGVSSIAGTMTAEGLDTMFAVHVMANRLMLRRWFADGIIRPRADGEVDPPRVVIVASESHRWAAKVDLDHIEEFVPFAQFGGMPYYGRSKLLLTALFLELSQRLNEDRPAGQPPRVAVHGLCPGPVNTEISRQVPSFTKPLVALLFAFFRSAQKAARPVLLLACSPAYACRTGSYLFILNERTPSERAMDPALGEAVWNRTGALLDEILAGKFTPRPLKAGE